MYILILFIMLPPSGYHGNTTPRIEAVYFHSKAACESAAVNISAAMQKHDDVDFLARCYQDSPETKAR